MSEKNLTQRQRLRKLEEENQYQGMLQNRTRARTVAVGGCGNGMIEVSMRGDFASLWVLLQPVEAVELLEQIAAACGVEVATRPKQNFSAWRKWENDDERTAMLKGASPWEIMNQIHSVGVTDMTLKLDLEREKRIKALEFERDMNQIALEFAEEQKMLEGAKKDNEDSAQLSKKTKKPRRPKQ